LPNFFVFELASRLFGLRRTDLPEKVNFLALAVWRKPSSRLFWLRRTDSPEKVNFLALAVWRKPSS